MKQRFAESPVLVIPDKTRPFQLESDASKFATGAVLRQQDANGDWHPCAYLSQSLNDAERNYQIYDRELLGIVRSFEEWRHLLEGSPHTVQVFSDHKNLTFFRTPQKLNRRQARWHLFLSQFDMELHHIPGPKMIQSDTLSRLHHLNQEENDNDDVTLLPDSMFIDNIALEDTIVLPESIFINSLDITLANRIRDATPHDDVVPRTIDDVTQHGPTVMKSALDDWKFEDGLTFYKNRVYVPADPDLRRDIVSRYHDLTPSGHPGQFGTLASLRRDFFWPGMAVFVKNYVHGCAACQQMKVNTHPTVPPLMPIPAHKNANPFEYINLDFITDLPESHGYNALMVVADHDASKGVILAPCTKSIDALGTSELLFDWVYKRFGLMSQIISDRGTQFASQVFQELTKKLGIESKMSTAYHPRTDGGAERVNQEVEAYLRIFCANHPEEWSSHITTMEFAHNQRKAVDRNETPFFLMMGYHPRAFPSVFSTSHVPAVEDRLTAIQKARNEAAAAHELARQKVAERITRGFTPFIKGQKVWLDSKNLRFITDHKKLAPKRQGPFPIEEVLGPLTYRLKLPPRWKIHPVFHASLLTPFHENDTHGPNFLLPPPDEIDGDSEWEVEAVLGHRRYRGKPQYLIKWKGYPTSDNSWEPMAHLTNAKKMVDAYKKTHRL